MKDSTRFWALSIVCFVITFIWFFAYIPVYQYLCLHPESYQSHVPKKILASIDSFDKFLDRIRPESIKNSQAHKDFNTTAFLIAGFLTSIPAAAFLCFGWTNLVLFPDLRKRMKKMKNRELFI